MGHMKGWGQITCMGVKVGGLYKFINTLTVIAATMMIYYMVLVFLFYFYRSL